MRKLSHHNREAPKTNNNNIKDNVIKKRINFDIPADQHTKLKVYAAQHGKTIKEVVTELVSKIIK